MPAGVDRFDEVRRAWIAAHQGASTIQRRRAELLGRKVRARQRAVAAAVPDPHDDTVIPPLWLRTNTSPASQAELLVVVLATLTAPIGWAGGWLLNRAVTQLIPGTLRAYPIAALLWSGAVLGLSIVGFYDPSRTLAQIVMAPWVCAQVAAVPFVAGVYGIARLRFHSVNLRFGTPASASSFLASARDTLISLEKPGSFTSSASGVA